MSRREVLSFRVVFDPVFCEAVYNGEQGYTDDKAYKAEQALTDKHTEYNPEARKSGRVADNLRGEDVTVNVLDDNDHNGEIDALDRVNEDEQQHTRDISNKRSEIGNDAEYTHNNAAEYGIGHIEDAHKQYIYHTDNKAVEYLACDKLTEGLVYLTGAVDNLCSDLRLEQAVEDFLN